MHCGRFIVPPPTRREMLVRCANGFGAVALAALMAEEAAAERTAASAKTEHFPSRARNIIFLYMDGGPSQVDTFDYKPLLEKLDGQPVPRTFDKKDKVALPTYGITPSLLGSRRQWQRHGKSGL